MRDLEERSNTEGLGEVGAQTREAQVVEKDIALHFLCNILDCAWVGEAKGLSPCLERGVCVSDGVHERIVGQSISGA